MTTPKTDLRPEEISLHSKSRFLRVKFPDGNCFDLPCEYLRVFSTAEHALPQAEPILGKEAVNIVSIEPQGQYAILLTFDDGHDTGIYSWETLYNLGRDYSANWQSYQDQLTELGYERKPATQERQVQLLYFSYLVHKLRKESEELVLPGDIDTVGALLTWLQKHHRDRGYLFAEETVRVTVNKQFAELFTALEAGDEVAIIPNSPNAPMPK